MVLRTPRDFELAIQKMDAELNELRKFASGTQFNSANYYTKAEVNKAIEEVAALKTAPSINSPNITTLFGTVDSTPQGSTIVHFLKHLFYGAIEFLNLVTFQSDLTVEGIFTANGDANFNNPVQLTDTLLVQGVTTFDGNVVFNDPVENNSTLQQDGAATFNSTTGFNNPVTFNDTVENNSTLQQDGATTFNNVVVVNGAVTFNNPVELNDQVLFDGFVECNNSVQLDGTTTINGNLNVGAAPGVTNSITFSSTVFILNYKDHAGINQTVGVLINPTSISANAFTKGVKTT